jgi:hypothetical protein
MHAEDDPEFLEVVVPADSRKRGRSEEDNVEGGMDVESPAKRARVAECGGSDPIRIEGENEQQVAGECGPGWVPYNADMICSGRQHA